MSWVFTSGPRFLYSPDADRVGASDAVFPVARFQPSPDPRKIWWARYRAWSVPLGAARGPVAFAYMYVCRLSPPLSQQS